MINRSARDPAYQQLADLLRAEITSGRIPAGELLPFEGRLAQEHGLGRQTVRKALDVLRREGLVVTERGYGTRVVQQQEREKVPVPRGALIRIRMPSEAERAELGIEAGSVVPVAEVWLGGRLRGTYVGDRTDLTTS
ncbi:GntR family transcriptional regulator [Micromonospora sp. M71_S20]|uniref:GntR family transcriptional regulator n=1 Tax=Micromonospora sp. M71_S20 TaxID=592872 RepID=UPI001315307D|nr:GntR family transcriptional regulator [Micromonospora sp. M71_S20]